MNTEGINLNYVFVSTELFDCSVEIRLNHYFSHNKVLNLAPHVHDHAMAELHAVLSGEVYIECGGEIVKLTKGDILCIPPRMYHRYIKNSMDAELYNLRFSIRKNREITQYMLYDIARSRLENTLPIVTAASQKLMSSWCALMTEYDAFTSDVWSFERLKHCSSLFFAEYFEALELVPTRRKERMDESSTVALCDYLIDKYFYYNIDKELSLEELAATINYSKSQTKRIIFALYGMSFKEKVLTMRLEMAKNYLRNTDYSVEKISGLVGYRSRNGFEQMFCKYVGMTPTLFRQSSTVPNI